MLGTILIMATTTVVFLIGINVGYRLKNNEKPVEIPKIEEIKKSIPITKEYKENKETQRDVQEKINRMSKIMQNVDRFDGSSNGQMEVK